MKANYLSSEVTWFRYCSVTAFWTMYVLTFISLCQQVRKGGQRVHSVKSAGHQTTLHVRMGSQQLSTEHLVGR